MNAHDYFSPMLRTLLLSPFLFHYVIFRPLTHCLPLLLLLLLPLAHEADDALEAKPAS